MESEAIDWEQDLPLDADEAYQSLVRSLKRTDGFSLLFVRCSPVQGDRIITNVRADLPTKTIEVLELKESIDNLYDHVASLPNREQINVLFIKGIEYSIFAYEDREINDVNLRSQSSVYGGTWQGIPRILGHLNLSRERFRDNFKFCFVFLLPEFALRYFIRRAPDFFDWRSNIYEFPTAKELVNKEVQTLAYLEGEYREYCKQTPVQRIVELSTILSYLDETLEPENEAALWFKKGMIHAAADECEEAITSYDRALQLNPDDYQIWYNQAFELAALGRYKEAISSYDRALQLNPNNYQVWNDRSNLLAYVGMEKEALDSVEKALKVKFDFYLGWQNRGKLLFNSERYEEALDSFDKAVQICPEFNVAWQYRGLTLFNLGRWNEAIVSYTFALQINPNRHPNWYTPENIRWLGSGMNSLKNDQIIRFYGDVLNKFNFYKLNDGSWKLTELIVKTNLCLDKTLENQLINDDTSYNEATILAHYNRYEEAISYYDKALEFNSDDYWTWHNRGCVLEKLGRYEESIVSYNNALNIKSNLHQSWHSQGYVLGKLGRYEEAIKSFEKAVESYPYKYQSLEQQGILLIKLDRHQESLISLERALTINPYNYEIWNYRGIVLVNLGRYEEAITSYDKSLQLKPDFELATQNRSIAQQLS